MGFKQKMSRIMGINESRIPSSYQIVGSVMLLKLDKLKEEQKTKLGEAVIKEFPYVKTVCEVSGVFGELREPAIRKLAGNGTETLHKENGIFYKLDVSQLMFSKGNLSERKRLIENVEKDEQIIDMFAGIGYFSLGLAKLSKAKNIIAIEKNPKAYNALIDNIQINKVANISAILGDCKIAAKGMPGMADRVLMGYLAGGKASAGLQKAMLSDNFPGTEQFLPAAIFMLKQKGTIHFHNIYSKKDLWSKPLAEIKSVCEAMKCSFRVLEKKKVKSYAPNVFHIVMDIEVEK